MKNFILGMFVMGAIHRNRQTIIQILEETKAKLELKRDIIQHDNPDVEK